MATAASTLPALTTTPTTTTTTVPPLPELPRGGRRIFPRFRVVGYYGMPGLDVLGAGPPEWSGVGCWARRSDPADLCCRCSS